MNKSITIRNLFENTSLWKHYTSISEPDKIVFLNKLIDFAIPILDRIIETFPTYTLHNGQHQLNILNLMSSILGDRIKELSSLETALLILSAFYHDIGMVFTEDEVDNLQNESDFKVFLSSNYKYQLALETNKSITKDIAEEYCRWAHAKRVFNYLDVIPDLLIWEGVDIKNVLGEICLSHNESVQYLKDDLKFDTSFWEEADLRFCAIILRISDILDFDNSRSPDSVFHLLKLEKPLSKRLEISHKEWLKHLSSKGFSFSKWNKSEPYELSFKATPDNPSVEHDIRSFLDVIDQELNISSVLIHFCSAKWNNFILPDKVNRKNIQSQGYKFGDFKFSLANNEVLNLLMGENIYSDPFAFLRELLQNSIDTSRDRLYFERSQGNNTFTIKPIEINSWMDSDGFNWVKIEDYGMGMTEDIIKNYFLKIGNSFYNSDQFKVRKLKYNDINQTFNTISRFGVGLLSCFMMGDLVEVNTKSVQLIDETVFPIRLSIKGLSNYFMFQAPPNVPLNMPCPKGFTSNYRREEGTSIAVRLGIDQDTVNYKIEELVKYYIFKSPVDIIVNGVLLSNNMYKFLNSAIEKNPIYTIPENELRAIEDKFNVSIQGNVEVWAHYIDLEKYRVNQNLSGEIIIYQIKNGEIKYNNEQVINYTGNNELQFHFDAWGFGSIGNQREYERDKFTFNLHIEYKSDYFRETFGSIKLDIMDLLRITIYGNQDNGIFETYSNLLLSYNGIIIPNKVDIYKYMDEEMNLNRGYLELEVKMDRFVFNKSICAGYLALSDDLRPDVSLSREYLKDINWNVLSEVNYAIHLGFNDLNIISKKDNLDYISLGGIRLKNLLYKDIIQDNLITCNDFWTKQSIFFSGESKISINDILISGEEYLIDFNYYSVYYITSYNYFTFLLQSTLLQRYCNVKIILDNFLNESGRIVKLKITRKSIEDIHNGKLNYFLPFTFVEYDKFDGFCLFELEDGENKNPSRELSFNMINIKHPFSMWIIENSSLLYETYNAIYWSLVRATSSSEINNTIDRLYKLIPNKVPVSSLYIKSEE